MNKGKVYLLFSCESADTSRKEGKIMPILLDHQLREQIARHTAMFPVTYFCNELASLPHWEGPLHWHTDFEIATALNNAIEFQVGRQHILLNAGESIFINGNMLHGIKQSSGTLPDPLPNIVFSGQPSRPKRGRSTENIFSPSPDATHCLSFCSVRKTAGKTR